MPRTRGTPSPPYPVIGLPEVLERGEGLVPLVGEGVVEHARIFPALGFGTANGTSKSILNTMRQYGFVELDGAGLRVNPDVGVLYGEDQEARRRALIAFARKPEIFRILEKSVPRVLEGDQARARAFLAERGYRASAVETLLAAYRTTHDLLDREAPERRPSGPGITGLDATERAADGSTRTVSRDGGQAPGSEAGSAPATAVGPEGERTLFTYGAEGVGRVRLVVDGDMPARDVVAIVRLWADITLRESGD